MDYQLANLESEKCIGSFRTLCQGEVMTQENKHMQLAFIKVREIIPV